MNRRSFLTNALAAGVSSTGTIVLRAENATIADKKGIVAATTKLTTPARGAIPVAIPISEGATVIDFAGPWDVFTSVMIAERGPDISDQMPFQLFIVSDKLEPVTVEGGMKIVPDYTFDNVPACKVAVVPAQRGSDAMRAWLRKIAPTADVTMSVCVGVVQLAKTGLLKGKPATIHHDHYDQFAKDFPDIDLRRGVRFVENEKISTAGGETCGIDLALRVVERYFGRAVAKKTAVFMEYHGQGWMV